MTRLEIEKFRNRIHRRIRGEFTVQERQRYEDAKEIYNTIVKNNGGKNPLFGF